MAKSEMIMKALRSLLGGGEKAAADVAPDVVADAPIAAKPVPTVNEQLFARPHGPRALAILQKQDAANKAGDVAFRGMNQTTRDAFDQMADGSPEEGIENAGATAQRFEQQGHDILNHSIPMGAAPYAPAGDSATDAIGKYRAADKWGLVADRLTQPDFNVPRDRYNLVPLAGAGLAGTVAAKGYSDPISAIPRKKQNDR